MADETVSSSAGAATEDKMARHARLRKTGVARFDRNLNLRLAPSLFFITLAFSIQPLAFPSWPSSAIH
jgi:hypothetical protein